MQQNYVLDEPGTYIRYGHGVVVTAGGGDEGDSLFKQLVEGTIGAIDDTSITRLRDGAFDQCKVMPTVYLPNVIHTGSGAFRDCYALTYAKVGPDEGTTQSSAGASAEYFMNCTNLEVVDLGINFKSSGLGYSFSQGAYKLATLVLRAPEVQGLPSVATFGEHSPIREGTGLIYVPDNLVDAYKAATNWSTFASQIKPLSEYVAP